VGEKRRGCHFFAVPPETGRKKILRKEGEKKKTDR